MAVKIEKTKCTGCGNCLEACPVEAIIIKDNLAFVSDACVECQACEDTCPNNAISL